MGTQRQNIILLGAGNKNELNNIKVRNLLASAIRLAGKLKAKQIYLFQGFDCPINDVAFGHLRFPRQLCWLPINLTNT